MRVSPDTLAPVIKTEVGLASDPQLENKGQVALPIGASCGEGQTDRGDAPNDKCARGPRRTEPSHGIDVSATAQFLPLGCAECKK